jgi:hypothetical protein
MYHLNILKFILPTITRITITIPDGSFLYQDPRDAPKRISAAKKSRISPRTGIPYIRDAGFSAREEIGRPAICVDSRARSAKGGGGSKGVREGGVVTRGLAGDGTEAGG